MSSGAHMPFCAPQAMNARRTGLGFLPRKRWKAVPRLRSCCERPTECANRFGIVRVSVAGPKPKPALRVVDASDEPIPDAPEFLDRYAMQEWHRLAPSLHADGRLTMRDMAAFAAYCSSYSRWRKAEEECATEGLTITTKHGNAIQNPKVGIANASRRDLVRIAAEFGLTPSARARFAKNGGKKDKTAAKFFGD